MKNLLKPMVLLTAIFLAVFSCVAQNALATDKGDMKMDMYGAGQFFNSGNSGSGSLTHTQGPTQALHTPYIDRKSVV